jgi:murein DD-endopeptidase MepM/ murein hydrolase activator NlpD
MINKRTSSGWVWQWVALGAICFVTACGSTAGTVSQQSQTMNVEPAVSATMVASAEPSASPMPPSATSTPEPTAVPTETVLLTVEPSATVYPNPTAAKTTDGGAGALTQRKLEATALPETTYTYVFPVQKAETTYGRAHHDYPATDIFCVEGAEFVAVTSGTVHVVIREDTWDAKTNDPALRSGMAVGIIGDDGVRYYGSHLSGVAEGIEVGMRVEAGQLLGYTGKSGNARATPPHLHFGISRPSDPYDWQVRRGEMNPYEFLRSWAKGIPLQPAFGDE